MELEAGFSNPLRGTGRDATISNRPEVTSTPGEASRPEGKQDKSNPKKEMEYVAAPGHGSGCGHCTGQAKWVPKGQGEQLRKEQKAKTRAEVQKHEDAHASAGGHLAGSPVVREHADGSADGEVPISIPKVDKSNPEKTMSDGDTIIRGAMAPEQPSGQDYKVAGTGAALKAEASAFKNSEEFKILNPKKFPGFQKAEEQTA
jgi:hypothetical protein